LGNIYSPCNNNVYVVNAGNFTASVINTSTDTVIGTSGLENYPLFLAYDSSNQGIYVSAGLNRPGIKLSIINTATNAHVKNSPFPPIVQNSRPMGIAYTAITIAYI
jgi:YVTN family beta-propeller protein